MHDLCHVHLFLAILNEPIMNIIAMHAVPQAIIFCYRLYLKKGESKHMYSTTMFLVLVWLKPWIWACKTSELGGSLCSQTILFPHDLFICVFFPHNLNYKKKKEIIMETIFVRCSHFILTVYARKHTSRLHQNSWMGWKKDEKVAWFDAAHCMASPQRESHVWPFPRHICVK